MPEHIVRHRQPPLIAAVAIALGVGLILGWWTYARLHANLAPFAVDFTYPWRAAGHLLAGRDPYQNMPRAPYAQAGLFLYPLPAALIALPVAKSSAAVAGGVFFGVSSGLFAYALARDAYWKLAMMASPAFVLAYFNVQWAPLILASALLPALGWLGVAKPNLGLIAFAYRPRWSTVIGGAAFIAISLLVLPRWPLEWLHHLHMQESPHRPPLLWPLGFVGLAGLLRWRTASGRLLAVMTLVPTGSLPYDHLFLWLAQKTVKESVILTVTSWAAYVAVLATAPHDLTTKPEFTQLLLALGMYLPAAGIVLGHRNEGPVPNWLERVATRFPSWLRGTPGVEAP